MEYPGHTAGDIDTRGRTLKFKVQSWKEGEEGIMERGGGRQRTRDDTQRPAKFCVLLLGWGVGLRML